MRVRTLFAVIYCASEPVLTRRARPLFRADIGGRPRQVDREYVFGRQLVGENVTRGDLLELKAALRNDLTEDGNPGQGQSVDLVRNTGNLASASQGQFRTRFHYRVFSNYEKNEK